MNENINFQNQKNRKIRKMKLCKNIKLTNINRFICSVLLACSWKEGEDETGF